MTVNGEDSLVSRISRDFLDVLIVKSVGHGEAIHLDAKSLFEQLFATDDLVLEPLLIFRWTQSLTGNLVVWFAQVLMRGRVRLDVDAGISHLGELFPRDRLASAEMTAAHAFGVNKHREWIAVFFQNGPGDFILRFPSVIDGDNGAARRNIFLAAFPGKKVLHADDGDAAIFQLCHLRFESRRRDLGVRVSDVVDEAVITKNDDLRGLIDNRLGRLERGGVGGGIWAWAGCGNGPRRRVLCLRAGREIFVLLAGGHAKREKQWEKSRSSEHN